LGHQPLFAFNEDCFGGRISTCSRITWIETYLENSAFVSYCLPNKKPQALMLYAIAEIQGA